MRTDPAGAPRLASPPRTRTGGRIVACVVAIALLTGAADARAQAPAVCAEGPDAAACAVALDGADPGPARVPPAASTAPDGGRPTLVVFWALDCPHCEQARPYVASLAAAHPEIDVEWVEVRQSDEGRARFAEAVRRLGVEGAGAPLFVVGDRAVVGFRGDPTRAELSAAVDRAIGRGAGDAPRAIDLPLVGRVDPARVSLPAITVLIGLLDGLNPCAFYVLVVLLGLLLHVRSRGRVALFGGVFVAASGLVYFLFMSAWLGVFLVAGLSRAVTVALGVVLVAMGIVNLKEIVWFKRGVSLMIPDRSKPGLFRRMRAIAAAASLPTALVGVVALAALVNLVELGCTLGLPAIYTRILSLRPGLSTAARTGYLALYNVAYVVPLAILVGACVATMRRFAMTERRAKVLKAVSGALLVAFGAVFLLAPGLLR